MKLARALVPVFIATVGFCGSVSAAVITVSDTQSATQGRDTLTDPVVNTTGIQQFVLPGFDSSNGTLTEINLTLSSTVSGDSAFMNTTPNSGTFTRGVQGFTTLLGLGFPLTINPTAGPVTLPVGPQETVTAFFGPVSGSNTAGSTSAGFLGGFTDPAGGTVSLDVNLNFNQIGTIQGDGGLNFTGNILGFHNDIVSTLQVDYIFTPSFVAVPEPGTLGLVGVGLILYPILRRRVRRRHAAR